MVSSTETRGCVSLLKFPAWEVKVGVHILLETSTKPDERQVSLKPSGDITGVVHIWASSGVANTILPKLQEYSLVLLS